MSNEKSASAWAREGENYRMNKNYARAKENFEKAIELNEDYAWAYAHLGATCRDDSDSSNEDSERFFTKAIELKPEGYAWASAHLGFLYHNLGRYQEALRCFNTAVDLNKEYAWAYAHRGLTLAKLSVEDDGGYEKAEKSLDEAIKFNNGYAWAYATRSVLRVHRKNFEGAVYDLVKALSLNPRIYDDPASQKLLINGINHYEATGTSIPI